MPLLNKNISFGHNCLVRGSCHGLVGECFDVTSASINTGQELETLSYHGGALSGRSGDFIFLAAGTQPPPPPNQTRVIVPI
jgi:hypothetical protein